MIPYTIFPDYELHTFYRNSQFLNRVIIIKTKVLPTQIWVTFPNFDYPDKTFGFLAPKNF
jgi:hypothetical protein